MSGRGNVRPHTSELGNSIVAAEMDSIDAAEMETLPLLGCTG
jgi:hypothetical protein